MILVTVLIAVFLLFNVCEANFRCPKQLRDGKGLVEISVTASSSSFTVCWHTNDLDKVDLVNLEYKCYPKEQRDNHTQDKTTVFVPLSQRLSGKQEIKVNSNNESMECEISGCYIDYDWGNANSIEKKIITIGELLSPSPTISLSPTSSVLILPSSAAVCSCSVITESKVNVVPSCTTSAGIKKRSTMQNEEDDTHNTGSTLIHQLGHSGLLSGLLGVLIVAVCVLALSNIVLVLSLKAKKSAKSQFL